MKKINKSEVLRAVPEIILRGWWAADTFLSCGGEGVWLTVCPRGGVGSNLSWGQGIFDP